MKKLLILALAVVMTAAMAGFALAGNGTGITNSPHDLRGSIPQLNDTGYGKSEICRICHSPHDHVFAAQNYLNGLLWNHDVSTATYTMYDAAWGHDIDGTVDGQPTGTSKLCLACHDGTVAVDSFDEYVGTVNITDYVGVAGAFSRKVPGFLDGAALDMRGTHPISITYEPFNGISGDKFLKPVTAAIGPYGLTIADVLDSDGKLNCDGCHDVHDANQEAVPGTPLLRADLEGSAICLACHDK